MRDCLLARQAAANGVTAKTNTTRQKYWQHWTAFAQAAGVNPLLSNVPPIERDVVTGAFAARVRSGHFGNGGTIKVAGVTDALAAISKTIELAGQPSPLYRADKKYQLYLEQVIEGFRRSDPLPVPQLAFPVTVPTTAYKTHLHSADPILKRTGCLMLVAFYYLLCVGEYTKPKFAVINGKKVPATRTRQFVVGNVGFLKEGKILKRDAPLDVLLPADLAVLKITNKKMAAWGRPSPNMPRPVTRAPSRLWHT